MKVFKFGGASVKDAESVRNVLSILSNYQDEKIIVVVSAMGKTTNALEQVVAFYYNNNQEKAFQRLSEIKQFHEQIIDKLFLPDQKSSVTSRVNNYFVEIEWAIEDAPTGTFDFEYDQIVSFGELISTTIIHEFIHLNALKCAWIDARDVIETDNKYREARINWEATSNNSKKITDLFQQNNYVISQGFIGVTSENYTTTLGREGSDFTAAIFAHIVNADSVTIWKDVPGVLNADPKFFSDTVKLNSMSYEDAIELSYFGVSVIHPRTVQPLRNKQIPLFVRSFMDFSQEGTIIDNKHESSTLIPCFIVKKKQSILTLSPRDFSFIAEDHFKAIFSCFSDLGIKINLIQNSAVTFRACMDSDTQKQRATQEMLEGTFDIKWVDDLELVTIRNYNDGIVERMTRNKKVLLEQRNKTTIRLVLK